MRQDITVNIKIFGPTLGHYDTYKLVFSQDSLILTIGEFAAICTDGGNEEFEWSVENFSDFFDCRCNLTPDIFKNCIGQFWMAWRKGELNNTKLKSDLKRLEEHLN